MSNIKSLWILLSDGACPTCNGPFVAPAPTRSFIPLGLFRQLADLAKRNSWHCTVVAGAEGVPSEYRALCEKMGAEVIVPAICKDGWAPSRLAVSFEMSEIPLVEQHPSRARAILRLRRNEMASLSEGVRTLFGRFRNIAVRHPEVLSYDAADMAAYGEQLVKIGASLAESGDDWSDYRLDCLTGAFGLTAPNDCGAGDKAFAVAPNGELYLCQAAMRAGMPACGHVLSKPDVPDGHLMTRAYALPCRDGCTAMHCKRCVYINKKATCEFCVPPANACKLAHVELAAQAEMAAALVTEGKWDHSRGAPPTAPLVDDPYELVKEYGRENILQDAWDEMLGFTGRPEDLSPVMMLSILCDIKGLLDALADFTAAGVAPSNKILEDTIASIRRTTIKRYQDCVFAEGLPTLAQMDAAMLRMCRDAVDAPAPSTGSD